MDSEGKMTNFIPNQAIIVIVGPNQTLQVRVLLWLTRGAETSSCRRPPALSNTDQMQPDLIDADFLDFYKREQVADSCVGFIVTCLRCGAGSPGYHLPQSQHAVR